MNRILEVCLIALIFVANLAPAVVEQPAAATQDLLFAKNGFAGTWRGKVNGLPGIDLTLREAEKKIQGEMCFYFQERAGVNSQWQVTAQHAVPLLSPRVTGKSLTFEVEHHVCHGCKELGSNVAFRMELAGINEARLTRVEEDGTEGAHVELVRGDETPSQAAPSLQAGISVQMPVTKNAPPMPGADREDALIVTLTGAGKVYVGLHPSDLELLQADLQRAVATQNKTLYIKPDARVPYATVMTVVDAAAAAGIERSVLLTSQPDSPSLRAPAPPRGFAIMTRDSCPERSRACL